MSNSPLAEAFAALNDVEVMRLIEEQIKAGTAPLDIVKELQAGMDIFSASCKQGEFFISDLILAGDTFQQAMSRLEPLLNLNRNPNGSVKIILGTVKGDIHNLGKDILALLLKASGFEVIDLGINVAPSVFVEKVRETGAQILGLSGLITPSYEAMKETVQAIEVSGLREKVKIIIGGGVVTQIVKDYTGADAFSTDAMEGVTLCKQLSQGGR